MSSGAVTRRPIQIAARIDSSGTAPMAFSVVMLKITSSSLFQAGPNDPIAGTPENAV
jgi:hypothetical protein